MWSLVWPVSEIRRTEVDRAAIRSVFRYDPPSKRWCVDLYWGVRSVLFLTSLLPGLRQLRAPLAVGLVWLIATWLAVAPDIPSRSQATGVFADLYELTAAVGKVPTLAAAAFAAYLIGILSVRVTTALAAANALSNRITGRITRPSVVDRIFALTPGGSIKRRQLTALRHTIMHRLLDRYQRDEEFQNEIAEQITTLYDDAGRDGQRLPEPFSGHTRDDLIADLADRPDTRVRTLRCLIDLNRHARELTWATHFIESAAATAPEVLDQRDRAHAEAEFRTAMSLPLAALILAVSYRTSPWVLALLVIPVWLVFLGGELYGDADDTILRAVMRGTVDWRALDYLDTARIHYRRHSEVTLPS